MGLTRYGLVWISTTLVFVIASLGNCATYLMLKRSESSTSWSFDVNYLNVAACTVYGYTLIVPVAFYFLLQYLGSNASLVRFWCMWGYSLSILVLSSVSITIAVALSFPFALFKQDFVLGMLLMGSGSDSISLLSGF